MLGPGAALGRGAEALQGRTSLIASIAMVLLIGGLGLVAGGAAGRQATDVHRADRLALQQTLAGLIEQNELLGAAEVVDALSSTGPWSAVADDPESVRRLTGLVGATRALDHGAVLLSALGTPLASWSVDGTLPDVDDPGWAPLRETARSGSGELPLSGVLTSTGTPLHAMALPVRLDDGSRALVIGLRDARVTNLQTYAQTLVYGDTGNGFIVDGAGLVLAGPDPRRLGQPLPGEQLRRAALSGGAGVVDTPGQDGGQERVTSFAPAGATGWTSLTVQDREEFEGALLRSSRLVQLLVVALLLAAGAGLVLQNRKREAALRTVALRDELTGVYNRRGWFSVADHELARARRQGRPRVLLFVDLDGLKQVNDRLGHREGDRAITAAAKVLGVASRGSDLVGRLGGDEFVLLLGDDGELDVARARVLEALRAHNDRSGYGFELRLSLGAEVWFPDDDLPLDELVRRADADMYIDKSARPGRSQGIVRTARREERVPVD